MSLKAAWSSRPWARPDWVRVGELVEVDADLGLGATDASIIALAERHQRPEIATLDRRHFHVVRPRHVDGFTLLP